MFGIGMTELMVVFVVGLVVLGPKRLPSLARSLGRTLAEFRHASNDLRRDFMDVANSIDLNENQRPDANENQRSDANENQRPDAIPQKKENVDTQDPASYLSPEALTAKGPRKDEGSEPTSE